jgi:hypothetical protein
MLDPADTVPEDGLTDSVGAVTPADESTAITPKEENFEPIDLEASPDGDTTLPNSAA